MSSDFELKKAMQPNLAALLKPHPDNPNAVQDEWAHALAETDFIPKSILTKINGAILVVGFIPLHVAQDVTEQMSRGDAVTTSAKKPSCSAYSKLLLRGGIYDYVRAEPLPSLHSVSRSGTLGFMH